MKLFFLSIFALAASVACACLSACQSSKPRINDYANVLEDFEILRLGADLEKPAIKKIEPFLELTPEEGRVAGQWRMTQQGYFYTAPTRYRKARFVLDVTMNSEEDNSTRLCASIVDTKEGVEIVNFSRAASDVSPKEFAAQIRAELFRALRGITVPPLSESDRVVGINRGNAFGFAFFAQMEKRGWRCVPVGGSAGDDFGDARFMAVFSGERSRYDFAKKVTGTLIDLKSGRAVLKITRHEISAEDFAEFFSNIINDPNQN